MRKIINQFGLYFAYLITLFAVFGSLYASEILGYKPCSFCWYQRVFLFPLAIILPIAAYRKDKTIIRYVIYLPLIGAFIALLQTFISYVNIDNLFCGSECAKSTVKLFGIIDFSIISFFGFSGIFLSLFFTKKFDKN
jgi:hypothetical protein